MLRSTGTAEMALDQVERIMARRQISALISEDPVDIVLIRSEDIPDGAGGFRTGPPTPLAPQRVTILPFKRRMSELVIATEMGDVIDYPYAVVGMYNLDIKRDDEFTWNGEHFVVHAIDVKTEVRTTAQVDYKGGPKNG